MEKNTFTLTETQRAAIGMSGWNYVKGESDNRTIITLTLPLTEIADATNNTRTFSFDVAFVEDFEKAIRDSTEAFNPEEYAVTHFRNGKGLEQLLKEGKYIKEKLDDLVDTLHGLKLTKKKKREFEDKCYEAYKLHWMLSHGRTLSEYVSGIAKSSNVVETLECPPKKRTTREHLVYESENHFVNETGFGNGSCYVCKDEFLQAEFLDENYMHSLFGLMEGGATLKAFYNEHYVEKEELKEGEKQFRATVSIDARFGTNVFAKDVEEAREKAEYWAFYHADLNNPDDAVEIECVCVDDENGDCVWEK